MKRLMRNSPDLHVRIQKEKTLDQLNELQSLREGKAQTVNSIINEALEMALPYMLEGGRPQAMEDVLEKHTQRIIMNINRQASRLNTSLQKLSILSIINEAMVGSIVQELEYFIKANGVPIPDELLEDFKNEIPKRFDAEKQKLIETLLKRTDNN